MDLSPSVYLNVRKSFDGQIVSLGDNDSEKFAGGFSFFDSKALQNLGIGEAIARVERADYDFNLKTHPIETVPNNDAVRITNAIIEHSRHSYSTPADEVALQIKTNRGVPTTNPSVTKKPGPDIEATLIANTNESEAFLSTADVHTDEQPVSDPGRGGRHHREIQATIKRMAELHGFVADIEKIVLDGAGSVDVSLEGLELKIACEVSVTTIDYETNNVQKCLAAGYDYVIVVVANKKKTPLITRKLDLEIPIDLQQKVKVFGLMQLLSFLRKLSGSAEPEAKRSNGERIGFNEACELLDKSPSTLYRWLREGRVPFYRVGREYEFDRNELLLVGKGIFQASESRR